MAAVRVPAQADRRHTPQVRIIAAAEVDLAAVVVDIRLAAVDRAPVVDMKAAVAANDTNL
jgi:hypothetical protein